jgi:hypothetical protein
MGSLLPVDYSHADVTGDVGDDRTVCGRHR